MRLRSLSHLALASLVAAAACAGGSDNSTPIDAARTDGATVDGGIDIDASAIDAPLAIDARPIDAPPPIDAPIDAIPTPSEYIGIARAQADGTGLSLLIVNATVTYIRPAITGATQDPAGFTIQVAPTGPALLVAVDPATITPALTPPLAVGDVVSFTITTMATASNQRRATAITSFSRSATGTDVNPLVQNLTAATDVLTATENYDAEIVDATATVAADFAAAGGTLESAAINTTGLTGNVNYKLRLPATLRASLELANGCAFTLDNAPFFRFGTGAGIQAQLTPYVAGDITVTSCPAPTVVSAVAVSATSIRITFSRNLAAPTVMSDGSQFTFDNGLTASAATASGNTVTVTTSTQTGNTAYTATVANTVTDTRGTALGTPATATFTGFVTQAVVRINEINAHIQTAAGANVCDLVELRVVTGGSMNGFYLRERDTGTLVTFTGLTVPTNAIIVVHTNSANTMCNPAGTGTQETTGPAEQPVATFTRNYDTAYDWYSTDTGITDTDNVITLYNNANEIVDAVFLANAATGTAAAGTETQAKAVADASQWHNDDGSTPANNAYIDDVFRANAALDLDATGTTAAGDSIRRIDDTDDNNAADWAQGVSTFGLINGGQAPF